MYTRIYIIYRERTIIIYWNTKSRGKQKLAVLSTVETVHRIDC